MTDEQVPARYITIPYTPRKHFIPAHNSAKRFKWICAHRRCGKTVFIVNHIIRAALQNQRKSPAPRYAYVGPSFSQAKDIVWSYLKHYISAIPGCNVSEGELYVELPNGARITLYGGATSYERMRGLYFDGVALDEYPLLHPSAFSAVVRPALSDYSGWAIVSGTPAGADHFLHLREVAEQQPNLWDVFTLPVYDTDALNPEEVELAKLSMHKSDFAREYLCSFEAAVEGSYYEDEMEAIHRDGRVCDVPYNKNSAVFTAWDLGLDDETAIVFGQRIGREIHWIDYEYGVGKGLDHWARVIGSKGYTYSSHLLPHDIEAREISSGKSRRDTLEELLPGHTITTVPMHKVEDGINAVRGMLSVSYFDKKAMKRAVSCLSAYQAVRMANLGTNRPKPLHNWASHTADAFRMAAMGLHMITPWSYSEKTGGIFGGALKRMIGGIV